MFSAYVVVTLMAITANTFAATADFMRFNFVLITAAKVGVPGSWLPMLGTLKAAGALGLLVGLIGVPLIGTAAAVGLVLFFVGAIITHLRARLLDRPGGRVPPVGRGRAGVGTGLVNCPGFD